MKYYEIAVRTVHDFADCAASVLNDFGCAGVAVYDSADLPDGIRRRIMRKQKEFVGLNEQVVCVKGFFTKDVSLPDVESALQNAAAVFGGVPSPETVGAWYDDAVFSDVWKRFYKTVSFDKIRVVPAWHRGLKRKTDLRLDPGTAFGTGTHETTYMCMQQLCQEDLSNKTVVDIGCGSGILGLSALKLGAQKAVLIDIDAAATEIAAQNSARNGLSDRVQVYCGDVAQLGLSGDYVLANITSDVLIALAPTISACVGDGAKLLLSGILEKYLPSVEQTYHHNGLKVIKRIHRGDWVALLSERI